MPWPIAPPYHGLDQGASGVCTIQKKKKNKTRRQGTRGWNEVKTWLAFYETERERQTEKHAHATRLANIAKSVVTTFGLNFFRLSPFRKAR